MFALLAHKKNMVVFNNTVFEMLSPVLPKMEGTTFVVQGSMHIGSYIDGGGERDEPVPGRRIPLPAELKIAYRKLNTALGNDNVVENEFSRKRKFDETTSLADIDFKASDGVDIRGIDQDVSQLRKEAAKHTFSRGIRRIFKRVNITQACTLEFQYFRPRKRMKIPESSNGETRMGPVAAPALRRSARLSRLPRVNYSSSSVPANGNDGNLHSHDSIPTHRPAPLRRSPRLSQVSRVDYSKFF